MSTNINITVGNIPLPDRAKQQQAANRQTQLEREATTQLESKAIAGLTSAGPLSNAKAIASGAAFTAARNSFVNPFTGQRSLNLITGTPFRQPQVDRRPTANRRGGAEWIFDYYGLQLFFSNEGTPYYKGTYKNGSNRETYNAGAVDYKFVNFGSGSGATTVDTVFDQFGNFLYLENPYSYGDITLENVFLYNDPTQNLTPPLPAFNSVTMQRKCDTPRPSSPQQDPSIGIDPDLDQRVAYCEEVIDFQLLDPVKAGSGIQETRLYCQLSIIKSSNNWFSDSLISGPEYVGPKAQDILLLKVENFETNEVGTSVYVRSPFDVPPGPYTAKLVYSGAMATVKCYIDNLEVLSYPTYKIIPRKKYEVSITSKTKYLTTYGIGSGANPEAEASGVNLKLYKTVLTFS
jgi:hypothetical protein